MKELRYTLLSDGSSDKALLPLLTWLLRSHQIEAIQPNWADLRRLPKPPKTLTPRILSSLELYPCDLLFIHRDAEREPPENRAAEIKEALSQAVESKSEQMPPAVCVVPVRMQEAWLLFDEKALRKAAGNPNGPQQLDLPEIAKLEELPDPKDILYQLLRTASGLSPTRLRKFSANKSVHRVAELIDNFTPLRCLPAFMTLEAEIEQVIKEQGWCSK